MNLLIRPYADKDLDQVVALTVPAFEPIFASFKKLMGPKIYPIVYPDWQKLQTDLATNCCQDPEKQTIVAEVDGNIAGFLVYILNDEEKTGEIYLLAVNPNYQNAGIGSQLNQRALGLMKAAGMKLAVVGTGGDEGHAPARRSYEKAGFTPIPQVWYCQALD